jgi:two-component system CheB/CheR fusion protein
VQRNKTNESKPADSLIIQNEEFPVIGIGASAGGIEALKSFFSNVSENSGMAYIVVLHMTANQPSLLPELLQKMMSIPVSAVQDGQSILPNHVYVIIPNKEITLFNKKIQLLDLTGKSVIHLIDKFFKSLGQDQGSNSAGIILSGTGTDGSLGIEEIKVNEGLVLAQSEDSSNYFGMPKNAIDTGLVDLVLPPEKMPQMLKEYFSHSQAMDTAIDSDKQHNWLNKICAILRTQVGHDFSSYKVTTIFRRIGRRMGLHHIERQDIYLNFLRNNPNEINALFRDFLIGVTSFFRDNASFEVLKKNVLPELFETIENNTTFRAWIPACSTGEEAYSLAIILHECLENVSKQINLQLFATDIDKLAIDKARDGIFPANITSDVSKERLKRYFVKDGDFYQIRRELRDIIVFSVQDVLKDPPFSRLNLLCCRNLLIYLNADAQKKLLPLFHYTLNPNGILMLGSSESIGGFSNLFQVKVKKWKIFKRKEVPGALHKIVEFPSGSVNNEPHNNKNHVTLTQPVQQIDISQLTQKIVLDQFSPPLF